MPSPTDALHGTERFAADFVLFTQNIIKVSNKNRPCEAISFLVDVLEEQVKTLKDAIENAHIYDPRQLTLDGSEYGKFLNPNSK